MHVEENETMESNLSNSFLGILQKTEQRLIIVNTVDTEEL